MKPWHINRSATIVQDGGILAYPTEAVYGLGCTPYNLSAVQRILRLKQRKRAKGLILVGYHISQFLHMVNLDGLDNRSEILDSWPGPITWVLPKKLGVPSWLSGQNKGIAVRISAHPIVSALCKKTGILLSTSANPTGQRPAKNASQVRNYFGNSVDFIYPGITEGAQQPTEIRDAISGRILRKAG